MPVKGVLPSAISREACPLRGSSFVTCPSSLSIFLVHPSLVIHTQSQAIPSKQGKKDQVILTTKISEDELADGNAAEADATLALPIPFRAAEMVLLVLLLAAAAAVLEVAVPDVRVVVAGAAIILLLDYVRGMDELTRMQLYARA
jgi:hypothetical protein